MALGVQKSIHSLLVCSNNNLICVYNHVKNWIFDASNIQSENIWNHQQDMARAEEYIFRDINWKYSQETNHA